MWLLPARRNVCAVFAVIACPSVRLSVSVTSRSCTKTATRTITQTTLHNSLGTLYLYDA